MINRLKATYQEFPPTFWVLIGSFFVDRLGSALIYPFLALYVTAHFNVGMVEVGTLFAIYAIFGAAGNFIGGALADKFGRKSMSIFGLLISSLTSFMVIFINELGLFYILGAVLGLFSSIGEPAQSAMVADLLPLEKRNEGYGVWRVTANLAVVFGPAIGGILASRSYTILFILDMVLSSITALLVFLYLPETKPPAQHGHKEETITQSFRGYVSVIKDSLFMFFIIFSILSAMVYMQMSSTLPVFLRDIHQVSTQQFGYLMSINALIVVIFQFWISRKIKRFNPMTIMAIGTYIYMVGFGLFGFLHTYLWFIVAMIIITIGEMVVSPTSQALVAQLSPEDKRGRYMALYGFSWIIPTAIGPLAAGLIMENYDPHWVWYAAGLVCLLSATGFYWLRFRVKKRT